MKRLAWVAAFFLIMMTVGCGTVVYRVNPDSPPQMSISEAMDAVELSMSMMNKHFNVESFVVSEDDLFIRRPQYGGHHTIAILMSQSKVYWNMIEPTVMKIGDVYTVNFSMTNSYATEYVTVAWKSEEYAKQFVNAAYVLRKRGRGAAQEQATAKAQPAVQGVLSEARPGDVAKTDSVKLTETVPEKKKMVVSPAVSARAKPPVVPPQDKTPPKITITSPDITRAVSVVAKKSTVTVTGKAESMAGIADVVINGQQADMDEKGQFSSEVLLKVGQNTIVVTAVDVYNNKTIKQFVINRASGRIAVAKAEAPIPQTGLRAAKYYALLIAVQDYNNPDISKLDYPLTDARQLMETLTSKYTFERENVVFLQNPDRRLIYKSFQDLRKRLTDKDNLLVFYAGHGMWMDDMRQGFWLPKDAAGPNDPSDWIPNSSIRDYIKAIKAKHVLLVADACFSGGIFKVREAFPDSRTSLEKVYEMPSRKAITSGSLKTVPDRSVFVEFLVKRLKDNRDPYLDTQKLFSSLREAVIHNSVTQQTPLYGAINEAGDEGGDFVFVKRP